SYRHHEPDKTWVRKTLFPRLRDEGLRVCIDFRNFRLGTPVVTEMGVPVVGVQKTTIRAFTVRVRRKTKGFVYTFRGRKPLIVSPFTAVFHPRTRLSSTPLRLVLVCPT